MNTNYNSPNFNIPPPNIRAHIDNKIKWFLENRPNNTNNLEYTQRLPPRTVKISDAKQKIKNVMIYKNQLNQLYEELQKLLESDVNDIEWRQKTEEIEEIKNKINQSMSDLKVNKVNIQKAINKRMKKRIRNKKRQTQIHEKFLQHMEFRKFKEKKIDENLKAEQNKLSTIQKTVQEKEQTKKKLSCVIKRISEANEKLKLFESLIELRRIRKIALQKDDDCGETLFLEKINKQKNLWTLKLKQYSEEKRQLEENFQLNFNVSTTVEQEWFNVLFGDTSSRNYSSVSSDCKDIQEFLKIRKDWDACIAPDDEEVTNSIPIFWVVPNANPSSDEWKKYNFNFQ